MAEKVQKLVFVGLGIIFLYSCTTDPRITGAEDVVKQHYHGKKIDIIRSQFVDENIIESEVRVFHSKTLIDTEYRYTFADKSGYKDLYDSFKEEVFQDKKDDQKQLERLAKKLQERFNTDIIIKEGMKKTFNIERNDKKIMAKLVVFFGYTKTNIRARYVETFDFTPMGWQFTYSQIFEKVN